MASPEGSVSHQGVLPPPSCPLHNQAVPFGGELLTEQDTGPVWERLRRHWGAVVPIEVEPGVRAWLLLGYDENLHVMSNPALYSHDGRHWREYREGRVTENAATYPVFEPRPNALHSDGEEHARLRPSIVDSLNQLTDVRLRQDIHDLANLLVDRFAADGRADLIGQYASQLPLLVINRFFGLSNDQGHHLVTLMTELWNGEPDKAVEANEKLVQYMFDLVRLKKEQPGQDVTSWMLAHEAELSEEEAAQQLMLILAAAHDPTSNLIGNAMRILLTDRTLRYELTSGQVLLQETLDQVLWLDPPFQTLAYRIALRDRRLGNVQVQAGDALILGFAPANADPALSPPRSGGDADFSSNRAHLAWGAGPHRCPAQNIARTIATTGIEVLIGRLVATRLDVHEDELRWRPSLFVRGLESLPVRFTPEDPPVKDRSTGGVQRPNGEQPWPERPPSPSSSTRTPATPSSRHDDSAKKAPSSLWNFLAKLFRGQ